MLLITKISKVPVPDISSSNFGLKAARLSHRIDDLDEVVGGFVNPLTHGTSAVHEQQQVQVLLILLDDVFHGKQLGLELLFIATGHRLELFILFESTQRDAFLFDELRSIGIHF